MSALLASCLPAVLPRSRAPHTRHPSQLTFARSGALRCTNTFAVIQSALGMQGLISTVILLVLGFMPMFAPMTIVVEGTVTPAAGMFGGKKVADADPPQKYTAGA